MMKQPSATWTAFSKWCIQRKLRPLPAHAWTVAAYLRWIDRQPGDKGGAKAAKAALDAISRQHLLRTLRVPGRSTLVARTMEMIERRAHVRSDHAALFDDQDALAEAPQPVKPKPKPKKAPPAEGKRVRHVLSNQPKLKRARPSAKAGAKKA